MEWQAHIRMLNFVASGTSVLSQKGALENAYAHYLMTFAVVIMA